MIDRAHKSVVIERKAIMEAHPETHTPPITAPLLDARGWDKRLARWISVVGSPPLLGLTAVALSALHLDTLSARNWAVVYVAINLLLPLALIAWLVRRGKAGDFDLSVRQERVLPLFLSTLAALACWLLLSLAPAPPLLAALALATLVQTALFFLITRHWKISMHSAVAAALLTLNLALAGATAVALLPVLPLIAWARVRLRRHTPAQTVAGACLGGGVMALALVIYQI